MKRKPNNENSADHPGDKSGHDGLRELLMEMAEESGPPTSEEQAWADDILDSFRKETGSRP